MITEGSIFVLLRSCAGLVQLPWAMQLGFLPPKEKETLVFDLTHLVFLHTYSLFHFDFSNM
jgi:hypothetical protein